MSDVSTGNAVEELEAHFESKSSPLLIEPLHKLKDPTKIYNVDAKTDDVSPKITRLKAAVYALPLPLTQGMNGGPVLMCKIYKTSSLSQIKCQLIGVVHGSGLIQDPDHKVNYKGLISLSPQILRGGYSYEPWENIHANLVQMSWNTHWQEAMAKMEGTTSDLEAEQQTMVLERFAKGRGRTPNLDLVADLDQSKNPDAGMQVAPPLKKDYLNNKLYPANVDMKKVLKTGMLQIPRRDRRIAAAVILSTMDIARQQPFTQKLFHISSHNPKKNDLASVKKLSGTFWSWDPSKNIRFATERFSGMIQTAQDATKDTFNIISCVHGIEKMDLRHVYFLPKGKSPTSNNFFQVQSFQVGGDYAAILNTITGVTSTVDDYAIIQVNNAAVSGPNTLKNILETEDMLEGSNVIAFQGESTRTDFTPDRVFAYGKPGVNFLKEAASEENGFCLVSDVFDGNMVDELEDQSEVVFQDNPLRKLVVPEEIHQVFPVPRTVPRTKDTQLLSKNQQAIPVFNYPGMSGGPILACQIEDTARVPQIKCVHFGVVSGSSLIRETDGKIFERGLIALPRSKHNRH